jgi:hypothetical protein
MNVEEYNRLINENNVLDHTTLNVTLKELVSNQEFELAAEIKRILENNQVPKPLLHPDPYTASTTYFQVDISPVDIYKIIDILLELETSFIDENGDTTPTASFYASLVDKWDKIK